MTALPDKLAAALVKAQGEMPAVTPDGVNPHYSSKFVTLGKLVSKVRPVLNKHGLAFAQFPSAHTETGAPTLVTVLIHESGDRLQFETPLLLAKSDPQGLGSALTYTKRYALASALGISDQEDDDGNAGSVSQDEARSNGSVDRITEGEVEAIYKHFETSSKTADQLKTKLGGLGVEEEMTSVRQALGLLSEAQAVALSTWLAKA